MKICRASPRALAQGFLVTCTGLFIASAAAWADTRSDPSAPPYVSPATVKVWIEEGKRLVFLDVREADEFAAGHLPGAINIVYDQVDASPSDSRMIAPSWPSASIPPIERPRRQRHCGGWDSRTSWCLRAASSLGRRKA